MLGDIISKKTKLEIFWKLSTFTKGKKIIIIANFHQVCFYNLMLILSVLTSEIWFLILEVLLLPKSVIFILKVTPFFFSRI